MADKALPIREKGSEPIGRRLESWKEIAVYLGRDVRTVQRWERQEGLPVHRLHHSKLGTVYAYASELDSWREGRQPAVIAEESDATGAPTAFPTSRRLRVAAMALAPRWRKALVWGLSSIALAALGAGAVWYLSPAAQQPIIRLTMGIAPADQLTGFR